MVIILSSFSDNVYIRIIGKEDHFDQQNVYANFYMKINVFNQDFILVLLKQHSSTDTEVYYYKTLPEETK